MKWLWLGVVMLAACKPPAPLDEPAATSPTTSKPPRRSKRVRPYVAHVPEPLHARRAAHSATMLPDGNVLLAGGEPEDYDSAEVEIYDASRGVSLPSVKMKVKVANHSATLLGDGRVVVLGDGSIRSDDRTPVVQIFYPEHRLWLANLLPDDVESLWGHSATPLADGRILVAYEGGAQLLSAKKGTKPWTAVAGSAGMAQGHAAVRLKDGRVLVAGGFEERQPTSRARLFDPETKRWRRAASLPMALGQPRAVLLQDGRALFAGGDDGGDGYASRQAAVYDPEGDAWTSVPMTHARNEHSLTLLKDGRVVAIGARGKRAPAELFDPSTNRWSLLPMPIGYPLSEHSATLLGDGRLFVAGGRDTLRHSYVYDPKDGSWRSRMPPEEPAGLARLADDRALVVGDYGVAVMHADATLRHGPPMVTPRARAGVAVLADGRVMVAGGDGGQRALASVEIYDPATQRFTAAAPMPKGRRHPQLLRLKDGRVLLFERHVEDEEPPMEVYDPAADRWQVTSVATPRLAVATALADGRVLMLDGRDGGAFAIDPRGWSRTPIAAPERRGDDARLTTLTDGRVMFSGGYQRDDVALYDPQGDVWTTTPGPKDLRDHTVSQLADGSLLTVGGTSNHVIFGDLASGAVRTFVPGGPITSLPGSHYGWSGHHTLVMGDALFIAGIVGLDAPRSAIEVLSLKEAPVGSMKATPPSEAIRATLRHACAPAKRAVCRGPEVPNPSIARHEHGSVTLRGGEVVVLGGEGDKAARRSIEVYDPKKKRWRRGPELPGKYRRDYTATALKDDRVLIVSSEHSGPSTHILDVNANTLREVASGFARYDHEMVTMSDGRVLSMCGSTALFAARDKADVYDPRKDSWTKVEVGHRLEECRLTALKDGRVLVSGGQVADRWGKNHRAVADSALFDPKRGAFRAAAKMTTPRYLHRAVVLKDGRVFVAGGRGRARHTGSTGDGMVRIADIDKNARGLKSSEIYDPKKNAWSRAADMKQARYAHSMTLLPDGRVLVAGGFAKRDLDEALGSVEIYDPKTDRWTPTAMQLPRAEHSAHALPDGSVLLVGGKSRLKPRPTVEVFSKTGCLVAGDMRPRTAHSLTALEDCSVIAAGGEAQGYEAVLAIERYDGVGWSVAGALSMARRNHSAMRLTDGRVLFVGGSSDKPNSAELFDPRTGEAQAAASLTLPRARHHALLLPDGRVFVAGGEPSLTRNKARVVEIYDPNYDEWELGEAHGLRRVDGISLTADGRVALIGRGFAVYDPETHEVQRLATPKTGTQRATLDLLPDGRLLLIGPGDVLFYDGAWRPSGMSRLSRFKHDTTWTSEGQLVVFGGVTALHPTDGPIQKKADSFPRAALFDPAKKSWRVGNDSDLLDARIAPLAGGRVLVTGGLERDRAPAPRVFDPARETAPTKE